MIYTKLTKKALALAFEKHKEQLDKSGLPYVFHPFLLATSMDTEETVCVALLHDIIEDTDVTADDLINYGFTSKIVDAVKLLTHDRDTDYFDYVRKIKDNPIAKKVKIADLKHNSDPSRLDELKPEDIRRAEKYQKALNILND